MPKCNRLHQNASQVSKIFLGLTPGSPSQGRGYPVWPPRPFHARRFAPRIVAFLIRKNRAPNFGTTNYTQAFKLQVAIPIYSCFNEIKTRCLFSLCLRPAISRVTRKPCCRKETARCRKCSFLLKFANKNSLQV